MIPVFLIPLLLFSSASCGRDGRSRVKKIFSTYHGPYVIYVSKKNYTLTVFNRDLVDVVSYRIGYGKNPDGKTKLYEGDNRTPEGIYHIKEILSMDADKSSNAYRKLKMLNGVYFRTSSGHHRFGKPDVDLGDNAYGPRFYMLDYPQEKDKKRYSRALEKGKIPLRKGKRAGIGFGIAIHGNNDPPSIGHRVSSGCIRMFNQDIIEMDQYIRMGMPVLIEGE